MNSTVEIEDTKCIRETEAAILVLIDDKEVWVPQSQVSDDSEVSRYGDAGTFSYRRMVRNSKRIGVKI